MKAFVGFLHAGEGPRAATVRALARRGHEGDAVHLVDGGLVDGEAAEFPIDDRRYAAIRERVRELAAHAGRVVLTCSVYNGVARLLSEDVGIPVERSDAAAIAELPRTDGAVGLLISYPPTRPIVVDYVSEVLAAAEQRREIRTSLAENASPFTTAPEGYRAALLRALEPLRGCGVLLVAQYTMNAHLPELRAAWGEAPLLSAVESALDALFPA